MSNAIDELFESVDSALIAEGIESIPEEDISRLLALAVKLYVNRCEETGMFSASPSEGAITATDVAVTTQGLLKAADLDLFELSLWRQWGWVKEANEENQQ